MIISLQRTWTKLLRHQVKGCHQKVILIQNHVNRRYRDFLNMLIFIYLYLAF